MRGTEDVDGDDDPEVGSTRHWLDGARTGDATSFGTLYTRIAPAMITWAELRIRGDQRTFLDPADLTQEVWFRAWRALPDFDPDAVPFRPWLFRIAKNVLLEASRQLQRGGGRARGIGPSTKLFALENVPEEVTAVSTKLARDEDLAAFAKQLRELPDEDRKLAVLCGLEGLPRSEVAQRMGLGVEAVTKRWQRLRAKLAERGLPSHSGLLDGAEA